MCYCFIAQFSWMQFSLFTQCVLQTKSCISNPEFIQVMLKLFPNVSVLFEQICIFKASIIAELSVCEINEVKLQQFQVCQESSLESSLSVVILGIPWSIPVPQDWIIRSFVTLNRYRTVFLLGIRWSYLCIFPWPVTGGVPGSSAFTKFSPTARWAAQ